MNIGQVVEQRQGKDGQLDKGDDHKHSNRKLAQVTRGSPFVHSRLLPCPDLVLHKYTVWMHNNYGPLMGLISPTNRPLSRSSRL